MTAPSPSETSSSGTASLRYPNFLRFLVARSAAGFAQMCLTVAVGWQVYDMTRRPLDLGIVGLILFLPQLLFMLPAGDAADRFPRRLVILICLMLQAVSAGLLALMSGLGIHNVGLVYAILFLFGTARTFLWPAQSALVPRLVPEAHLANAILWTSQAWKIAVITGPVLGGFLYDLGAQWAYVTAAGLYTIGAIFMVWTSPRDDARESRNPPDLATLLAGVRYVLSHSVLLGAISLDLFAVLFGGATALLPIYAHDILRVGPVGLGLLRSAPAIGSGICALILAWHPLRHRVGVAMFACVAGFGVATIVFGISTNVVISLLALAFSGAFDMISVNIRQTLVQLHTPDAMRGRVSAVNMLFIGTSNELGEFESGTTAAWFGTVPAVVVGGVGTLAVVAIWSWRFRELRRIDQMELPPEAGEPAAAS
jgi:MFS family permease